MTSLWEAFQELPFIARVTLAAGVACGLLGGVIGLVVGLDAIPGTAWFAVIELGLPSFVSGCFLGFFVALIWQAFRNRQTF